MILRREPQPRRKVTRASERAWIGHLHGQHRSPDRAYARYLRQAPAKFVAAVPSHQLGFHSLDLHLELRVFFAVQSEQFFSQSWNALVRRDPRQQRLDLVESFGSR